MNKPADVVRILWGWLFENDGGYAAGIVVVELGGRGGDNPRCLIVLPLGDLLSLIVAPSVREHNDVQDHEEGLQK